MKLPTDMPAIAPLLRVDVAEREVVGGGATEEDDVAEVEGLLGDEDEVEVVVFVGLVVDEKGEAVEPAVMRFRYESVTAVAVAPQYMMYWSSRILVMVTQAGAAEELDHES